MAHSSNEYSQLESLFSVVMPPNGSQRSRLESLPENRSYSYGLPISEYDIREAVAKEAKARKLWRYKALKNMQIDNIEHSSCFHYVLESFTEQRSIAEATEPYTVGAYIDNAPYLERNADMDNVPSSSGASRSPVHENGQINPWEYIIEPSQDFVAQTRVIELPGSSKLTTCSNCNAEGQQHCFHCRGNGTDKCNYCRGTGMKAGVAHPAIYTHPMIGTFPHADTNMGYPGSGSVIVRPADKRQSYAAGTPVHFMMKAGLPPPGIGQHDLCIFCRGRGIKDCSHCKGQGRKSCITCNGTGSVKVYTKLKIFFAVERSDFFTESEIPQHLFHFATGDQVFYECHPYVLPLKKFEAKEVNEGSRKLCAEHLQRSLGSTKMLKQRHFVDAIPVAKVYYTMGKHSGTFWVYGKEHLCYIPKKSSNCVIL
uniref:Protein SSUH2 homolog n=1 Tax=Parastrongyloides trichosuri TaxID=131310 RepID=A0A0N4Z012_PARTI